MDKSVDSFETKTEGVEQQAFKTVMGIIKNLDLKDGRIKPTAKNVGRVTIKPNKIFTPKYEKAVKDLLKGIDTTTDLTDDYFATIIKRPG